MKTRIKMHQMPGDVCKSEKIAMMEKSHSMEQTKTGRARSKGFRKMIQARERAVLKEREREEINNAD